MKTIIRAKYNGAHVKAGGIKSLNKANKIVFLEEHFYYILLYSTLKIFKEYIKVK